LVLAVFLANMRFTFRPEVIFHMLFADSMAGGTVVSVHKKWYKSWKMWVAVFKLSAFLARQSAVILFKGAILPLFARILSSNKPPAFLEGDQISKSGDQPAE